MEVSHILFVNDTVILCDVNQEHLEHLSQSFMWFEMVSNLKINMEKSKLIPIREVADVEGLASCWVIGQGSTHYLLKSPPLGAPHKLTKAWGLMEEKFQKKLAM